MAKDNDNPFDDFLFRNTGKTGKEWESLSPGKKKGKEQIPLFPAALAAVPNAFARSALFAPIRRGRRAFRKDDILASRGDVSIKMSGIQMDMADAEVWQEVVRLAQTGVAGESVPLVRYQFLKTLGRATGKANYLWLHESLKRIALALIELTVPGKTAVFHLIDHFRFNEESDTYEIMIDPLMWTAFHRGQYALIDPAKRRAIKKRVDLAKWLQAFNASNDGEQFYTIANLQKWSGGEGHLRNFRVALKEALGELARIGEIAEVKIDEKKVSWRRIKSSA